MTLLFITTGNNCCVDFLKEQKTEVNVQILDLAKDIINGKRDFELQVMNVNPDLILVYRCPYILSKSIYSSAQYGAYNIHPSLLPKYAGLNPWNEIFKNKEAYSGVTLHKITDVIDSGEVIYQESFRIEENDTIDTARHRADIIAAKLVNAFWNTYILNLLSLKCSW